VPIVSTHLPHSLGFSPTEDFEAFLKRVPARWVVYLLTDADDQPIQLLCVKNLRYSLKRRLGGDETVGPSRRVNYRDLVRRIYWRPVESTFEADWIYYEAARELFPQTYQGMVGFRPAWFIHVNPQAAFPRYVKTIDLTTETGTLLGPLEDKHAAARLIQLVEDAFDLCRYYNILLDAPTAKACAYKEMGKCPAPCDGTISMDQYRRMIESSLEALINPAKAIAEQTIRMKQAAAELRFEVAAKIKAFLGQISELGKGAFRYVRELKNFRYVSLQRGPRDGNAKVFLITRGDIEEIAGLIGAGEILPLILEISRTSGSALNDVDGVGAERIGVVAHHLFAARQTSGVFLPVDGLDDKTLAKAFRDVQKQKVKDAADEEGLVKELQAL
jgi:excinuclease UvrABC nuclease subunit